MIEPYMHIEFDGERTLQDQVKEHLVGLILAGKLPAREPLPSSRRMASMLGVSRNTIVLIYEHLVDTGYLLSVPRRGYFLAPMYATPEVIPASKDTDTGDQVQWHKRFCIHPGGERNIVKPNNWASFEYPFIYGQVQHEFFPIEQWRDCARKTLHERWSRHWIDDRVDADDPMLVEQLCSRLLPRRGIYAEPSEILITIGTQNSLYLLANLLCKPGVKVGLEDPGFRDARNIFATFGADLHLQPVDRDGVVVDQRLQDCDYVYLTPSHQVPTGAVLSSERRRALLAMAQQRDMVLIEDDYDAEINMQDNPTPALKAMDRNSRVVYIGSMSKSISPGLRIGFMVADEELIAEARSLRRLMYRHPPTNNQRQLALFLSQGYYDTYLRKIRELYRSKLDKMVNGVERYLPGMLGGGVSSGATSLWLHAEESVNAETLAWRAAKKSVLIEPGGIHFAGDNPPANYFRLGFSAIPAHKIMPGIQALADSL
ncbi:PLP-dependent aminotransferase family protein [Microbulbifer bruguierae]|uniref:PLP-dependent aminotransferase family protein n=1 Tax=Microbulbifer bruguierae TaxID=3029061 RepID=A0ABY8NBL0_9GAMM|nr:PLP-dependent aminotransferase family protein [Microbulbifer bruguierae]WGL15799.1 PLP-dependent aminotransferase family protein [Microbulbifer bruguierae]